MDPARRLLVRHPETEGNAERRSPGLADLPVNARTREQTWRILKPETLAARPEGHALP